MTTYADLTSTNLLISTNLETDLNPIAITKDADTGALNIAGKVQVNNGTTTLDALDNNAVPSAKNVKDALEIFSTTDSSTLSALQAIQAEFASGGDVATAINNIANQASSISALESTQSSQASSISALQSTQSSQASTIASANSNISALQSTVSAQTSSLSSINGSISTIQSTQASQATAIVDLSNQTANVVSVDPPAGGVGKGTISIGAGDAILTWAVTFRSA